MRLSSGRSGFRLIETLVVIGLSAVIGVSLLSSFVMGMKVWRRTASPDFVHRKAILGLEKLSRDLRSVYDYPDIGFTGGTTAVSFANIDKDRIWNVSYFYSSDDKCLYRTRLSLEAGNSTSEPKEEKIICSVEGASFSYSSFNNDTKVFDFLDGWNYALNGIPRAVKAEINLKDDKNVTKIITIPVAQ